MSKRHAPSAASRRLTCALVLLLCPAALLAADSTEREEPIVLSPFSVSSERAHGYQATDSITATGIGTKIRDVPVNIAVVTDELIRDRGVDDVRWIANTISGVNANTREFTAINIRGFEAPIQQDGFDGVFVSMEDVERIEVIKGPSAVFFGTNLPGGMMNVVKAKPRFTREHYVSGRYGSYDSSRVSVMSTGPLLGDELAYRVFASNRREGGELDHSSEEVENYRGALTWRPVERVSLMLTGEFTEKENLRHHGFPVGHPAYIAAARAGLVPVGQAQRIWLDQNPQYGPNEPLGQVFMHKIVLPYDDYNTQGPDSGFLTRSFNAGLVTDVNILSNLDVNVGLNWYNGENEGTEWNSFRPVAGAIPGTFYLPPAAASFRQSDVESQSLKARVSYRPEFLRMKHSIVAGFDDLWNRTATRDYAGAARTFNPLTDPPRMLRAEIRANNPGGLVEPDASTAKKSKTRGYYVTDQIGMFENRLRLMVGVRHTETTNPAGLSREKTTPQYAAMFTPFPAISVFANVSETFQPNYIVDAFGESVGPTLGKGKEAGLKLGTADERTSITLSVYENTRSNVPARDFPREALLDIRPIYQLGGLERNRGFEVDVHLAPTDAYQIVASYTYSWEHETIASTGELRQVGVDLANVPDHVFNLWNRYTFTSGRLRGVFVGGGARFATGEKLHPSWDVVVRSGGYARIDAVVGYERTVGRQRFSTQLNLNNLTNERAFLGSYILSDPFTAAWSVRWDF